MQRKLCQALQKSYSWTCNFSLYNKSLLPCSMLASSLGCRTNPSFWGCRFVVSVLSFAEKWAHEELGGLRSARRSMHKQRVNMCQLWASLHTTCNGPVNSCSALVSFCRMLLDLKIAFCLKPSIHLAVLCPIIWKCFSSYLAGFLSFAHTSTDVFVRPFSVCLSLCLSLSLSLSLSPVLSIKTPIVTANRGASGKSSLNPIQSHFLCRVASFEWQKTQHHSCF